MSLIYLFVCIKMDPRAFSLVILMLSLFVDWALFTLGAWKYLA